MFADETLEVAYPYWHDEPREWDDPGTYAALDAPTVHNRTVEWSHGLGDVVSAVIEAGLVLELLHEHPYTLFPRWPFLERGEGGTYRLPAGVPALPLYVLAAGAEAGIARRQKPSAMTSWWPMGGRS